MTRTSAESAPPPPSRWNRFSFRTCSSLPCSGKGRDGDLVQEKRAAFGQLQLPVCARDRAGKRAALVAEQLAVQKRFAQGRAIDRHKGPVRPRTACRAGRGPPVRLPAPFSPAISTVASSGATLPMNSSTWRMAGVSPTMGPLQRWRRSGERAHFLQQEHENRNAHGDPVAMDQHSFPDGNAVHEGAVLAVVVGEPESPAHVIDGAVVARHAQVGLRERVIGFSADGETLGRNGVCRALERSIDSDELRYHSAANEYLTAARRKQGQSRRADSCIPPRRYLRRSTGPRRGRCWRGSSARRGLHIR